MKISLTNIRPLAFSFNIFKDKRILLFFSQLWMTRKTIVFTRYDITTLIF